MGKLKIILASVVVMCGITSCELLQEDVGLSDGEIIEGLKTALEIGADSASSSLSVINGYYHGNEQYIKIPLPEEAENIRNTINGNGTLSGISSLIGLDNAFEDVVLAVNRAAEDAAKEAAPVFKDAITDLSIAQGWDILHGRVPEDEGLKAADFDSTAATRYLQLKTYDPLTALYAPKINISLQKDIIGNISAYDAWDNLTSLYNSFISRNDVTVAIQLANALGGDINLPGEIETDIGVFSTQKALDGLFFMVGEEEKKIRRNPLEWAIDIIRKVFGSVS